MAAYLELFIAFLGAFIAGGINALSGNGSVITLSVLTELIGLPGTLANGTNRVGVFLNSIGSLIGFYRKGNSGMRSYVPYILPVVIGAVAGIVVATRVSNAQFMNVFRVLMVVMLFVILVKPEKWLHTTSGKSLLPQWLTWPAMLLIGFYGGFIQMGMGIFFLAVTVLLARLPMMESNRIKVFAIGIYTGISLLLFSSANQISWPIGLTMGAGQFIGGWMSAHYGSRMKGAEKLAYYVLVVAVVLSVLKLFGLF